MIAIGNGEKCLFCDLIMKDNMIGGEGMLTHMQKNHEEKMLEVLFPEKENAHGEGTDSGKQDDMVKVHDIHRKGYLTQEKEKKDG